MKKELRAEAVILVVEPFCAVSVTLTTASLVSAPRREFHVDLFVTLNQF